MYTHKKFTCSLKAWISLLKTATRLAH